MASMARTPSSHSLMGFSVHQPAIGAALQFFPAMGSKQLDEMINAYVPGNASILDKRAAVSVEFFEHTMATGELFKFFMVYPNLGTSAESPASSSASGSGSSFNTSPVMSESQWTQTSGASLSPSRKARAPSFKKAVPTTSDFSHIPGMKIMTKDGRDVTNSASRGCKTKEQRDHAHLMRIIKACEACRKKKIRCDPSHKRRVASSPEAKVTKKAKVARPAAAPPQKTGEQAPLTSSFDSVIQESTSSFSYSFPELNMADSVPMEWDQFIQYDEELTEPVPYDYDFFSDPAGFFSPATSATNTSFTSPSQPITPVLPADPNTGIVPVIADTAEASQARAPTLPYMNPGGLEAGNNYVDFNLYSPGSSVYLDDDPSLTKEVAASPGPDRSEYISNQSSHVDRYRHIPSSPDQAVPTHLPPVIDSDTYSDYRISSPQHEVTSTVLGDYSHYHRSDYRPHSSSYAVGGDTSTEGIGSPGRRQDLEHYSGLRSPIQGVSNILQSEPGSGYTQYRLSAPANELGGCGSGANHGDIRSAQSTSPAVPGISSSRPGVSQSGSSASPVEVNINQYGLPHRRSIHAPQGSEPKGSNSMIPVDVDNGNASSRNASTRPLSSGPVYYASTTSATPSRKRTVQVTRERDTIPASEPVHNGQILSLVTTCVSSARLPLPSPDRPPVSRIVYNDRAMSRELAAYQSSQTQVHAALDTTRGFVSTSYATPRHTIAAHVASWIASRHPSKGLRLSTTDDTCVSPSESNKRRSSSVSTLLGVARAALERSSVQWPTAKRAGCPSSDNNSRIQRLTSSCLIWILAIVGLGCSLYALSGVLGTLPILIVVACMKLLQQSTTPCIDKLDVSAQPLSPVRQWCVAITDSVQRKYAAVQSEISIPIRRSIAKRCSSRCSFSPYSLRCSEYGLKSNVLV